MSCEQKPLLQRLAVEHPAALQAPSWKSHLESCLPCRQERHSLERSLAVFRQFESQPPPRTLAGPSWDVMAAALRRHRRGPLARARVPLAAASLLVALGSGLLLWPGAQAPSLPRPATIVTLQPDAQDQLRRVLHSSLQAPAAGVQGGPSHESRAVAAVPEVRFVLTEPASTTGGPVADAGSAGSAEAANAGEESFFARPEREQAPVLLFRSLQQRRSQDAPLQVLPVLAPLHTDPGGLLPRALLTPRPIR